MEDLLHDLIIKYSILNRPATQVLVNRTASTHPVCCNFIFGVILAVVVLPYVALLLLLINGWLVYYPTLLALFLVGVRITIHLEILIYAGIVCYTSSLLRPCKDIVIARITMLLMMANILRACYAIKLKILILRQ